MKPGNATFRRAGVALALICFFGPGRSAPAQEFGPPELLSPSIPISDLGADLDPQVTTDGAGNWVAVWESSDSLGGTTGTDYDIAVARSTDDGATWTVPTALNTNAGSDSGLDVDPQVSTDGAGNWVAVWMTADSLGGTIGTDGDILVARSTDNGATWTAPTTLNANAASDSRPDVRPQVATDAAGQWVAVWESYDDLGGTIGTDPDILVARSTNNGATWTASASLNTNAASDSTEDTFPQVATDGIGNWVAVWTLRDFRFEILVARSTDAGATWTAPAYLDSNATSDQQSDHQPQIVTDGAGNWVAVWDSAGVDGSSYINDSEIAVARSTDNGATWTPRATLNSNASFDDGHDFAPQIATDGLGNWLAVWRSEDDFGGTIGNEGEIYVARSSDDGATWTDTAVLNSTAAGDSSSDNAPQVATDGAGEWITVWFSNTNIGGSIGGDTDILKSHSTNNGANWTAVSVLNSNASADEGVDTIPQIATDGSGNFLAVWRSTDSLGGTIGPDNDYLVSRSVDAGANWTAPAPLFSNAGMDSVSDNNLRIAADGAGNWVAAWQISGLFGIDLDLLVARSADDGMTWTVPAILNADAASDLGNDTVPDVATDGAGNWIAVWEASRALGGTLGSDRDALFALSTDAGATWTAPAALNTNAASDTGTDLNPRVVTDGSGSWVAVWSSNDSLGGSVGTDSDIFLARSTDDGTTWTAPAALNTNASSDTGGDTSPRLVADGAGNWLAVWTSTSDLGGTIGTDADILAARSTDGGASWTAPAVVNSYAASDSGTDSSPQLATDRAGNWIAIWQSNDTLGGTIGGDNDVLMARSTDNGTTWTAATPLNTNAVSDVGSDIAAQIATDRAGHWVAVWQSDDPLGGLASYGVTDIFVASGTLCGDELVVGSEQCDVGADASGDCCSASCEFESAGTLCDFDADICTQDVCTAVGSCGIAGPLDPASCLVAPATKLQITYATDPLQDKLAWQWSKGDGFAQDDLGAPTSSTTYTLCVYDTSSSVPGIAKSLVIDPSSSLWTSTDPKGVRYKDSNGGADGVTKVQLKTGGAARTKVKLQAKGIGLDLPAPVAATYFHQSPKVVVQLRNSEGECWTSEFASGDTSKNAASGFRAQTK